MKKVKVCQEKCDPDSLLLLDRADKKIMLRHDDQHRFKWFTTSLVVHGFLMLLIGFLAQQETASDVANSPVEITLVETTNLSEQNPLPANKTVKKVDLRKQQIVDQDELAVNDEIPDDPRFLSRHNQVVKKQTVAKERGEFQNQKNKKAGLQLKPEMRLLETVQKQMQREQELDQASKDGYLPRKMSDYKDSSKEPMGAQAGGDTSRTLDYIKDLDPGLETLLSTREFIYYSYFNRIRNQLNQYWTDQVRSQLSKMYKKGRMIASTDDMITKCLVTLDRKGRLLKVQIIGDSGVQELDEAAVEAFRSAQPFPNPPEGMIEADGTIKLRWDFILEA